MILVRLTLDSITGMFTFEGFTRTFHFLNLHPPKDVIFADNIGTHLVNPLSKRATDSFDCEQHIVKRSLWNRDEGEASASIAFGLAT